MRTVLTAVPFLVLPLGALAGEPTIAAMLKEAKAMAVKPGETPQPGIPDAKDSAYVTGMKALLERQLGKMVYVMRQRRDHRGQGRAYFDIQRYREALQQFTQVTKNERDWHVRHGFAHNDLAKVYMMLDQKERAESAAGEFKKRVSEPWMLDRYNRLKGWMDKFDKHKAEVEKLLAKAAADPKDAESRWRLLDLYRYDYPRKLDEFVGLMKFREAYPKHKAVAGGECEWRLMEVMWRFGIRDEALKLAEKFREAYLKHRSTTYGDASYRLGGYYESYKRYAQALECYKEVGAKYPKHWANRRREDRPSRIQECIFRCTKKLQGRR